MTATIKRYPRASSAWIAIDPGPHTGIAIWFPDTKSWKHQTLMLGPFPDLVFLDDPTPHQDLWNWLDENVQPYDHLIVEKFEYDRDKARNAPAIDYSAAEYVGVVKLWAEKNNVADFCYLDNGVPTTEDYKGMVTDVYKLKRKMMLAFHGITIKET